MKKPVIGVVPLMDYEKESYWMLPGYMKGIEDAGGIPVMLPFIEDENNIYKLAEMFDGFLFTGGHDIHPSLYGEKNEFCEELCAERDKLESILFKKVAELDKPAFGICRGLQLFNVLLGGTLYQDIPTQLPHSQIIHSQDPPYTKPSHTVLIEKDSILHQMLKTEVIKVNSYHHQGIKKLSNQLISLAKSEDGLIEAVCMPNKKFIFAVQWHPELNYKVDKYSFQLFVEFVKACS